MFDMEKVLRCVTRTAELFDASNPVVVDHRGAAC